MMRLPSVVLLACLAGCRFQPPPPQSPSDAGPGDAGPSDAGSADAGPRECELLDAGAGQPGWCVTWLPDAGGLSSLWGSDDDDLWLAGDLTLPDGGPALLHHSDAGWTWVPAPCPLGSLSGSGPGDVWGAGGCIAHFDGLAWAPDDAGFGAQAIWVAAPGQPWVLSDGSVLRREDGGWRDLGLDAGQPFSESPDLRGLGGSGPDDVWAVGGWWSFMLGHCAVAEHWEGGAWAQVLGGCGMGDAGEFGPQLASVAAASPGQAWAVGWSSGADTASPGALAWDGQAWTEATFEIPGRDGWSPGGSYSLNLVAVSTRDGRAWAAGSGGVTELGGAPLPSLGNLGGWNTVPTKANTVWVSPTTIWAAGDSAASDARHFVARMSR